MSKLDLSEKVMRLPWYRTGLQKQVEMIGDKCPGKHAVEVSVESFENPEQVRVSCCNN